MVTSPAVPPYSSSTIARWVLSRFMSASTSSTSRVPGTKSGGRMMSRTVLARPGPQRGQDVLGVHHADDLVQGVGVDRIARPAGRRRPRRRRPRPCRSASSATIWVRGVMTSCAFFSLNSKTPSSSRASCLQQAAALGALLHQHPDLFRRVEPLGLARRVDAHQAGAAGWPYRSEARSGSAMIQAKPISGAATQVLTTSG